MTTLKKKKAFTLIEIIIASSILSVFLGGVFLIYNSSTRSFLLGTWKSSAQKSSQRFLEEFRTILEQSGNAYTFGEESIKTAEELPIRLNNLASGTEFNISTTEESTIAFSHIITPRTIKSPLSPLGENGKWICVQLTAEKGKLSLTTFNTQNSLRPDAMGWVISASDFDAAPNDELRQRLILKDVETIHFENQVIDGKEQVLIRLKLTRPGEATTVTQEITAKLLEGSLVEWF